MRDDVFGKYVRRHESLAPLRSDEAHAGIDGTHNRKDVVLIGHVDEVQLGVALEAKHDHEEFTKVIFGGLGKVVRKEHGWKEGEECEETSVHYHHDGDRILHRYVGFLRRHEYAEDAEISQIRRDHASLGIGWKGGCFDRHGWVELG